MSALRDGYQRGKDEADGIEEGRGERSSQAALCCHETSSTLEEADDVSTGIELAQA